MNQTKKKYNIGSIVSADLTVPEATALKDFYAQVIGWTPVPFQPGEDRDYIMKDSGGNWAGGVCLAAGANTGIPPQWIVYVNVADVKYSVEKCLRLGGKIVKESFDDNGNYNYAMIQDPSGAVLAVTHVADE